MNEWKKVKLGDCISTKKGFAFKSSQYTTNGIPVVRVSDFTLDSIANENLVYYPISEKNKYLDYILNEKEILIQTVGSWQNNPNSVVGKVVHVPYFHTGSLLNQNIVKIIPTNAYERDFIYYRLKCSDFSGYLLGEARGAANQASITLDTIKRFTFLCPDLPTQHRIATILSRYDSLIENYQKQIKLLEEAAQRLYKEWFVDLRFPGHENTTITDGVPEGWEKKKLGEVAEVNKRMISKDYSHSKIEYIDLGSVRLGSIDSPTIYERGQEPGRAKRIASDLDLIWGMVRPNLKAYALVQKPNEQMVFSTGFAVITATKVPSSYLYSYVTTDNFIGYLVNCTNGAAYPAVKPSHFEDADVIVPTSDLLKQYDSIVIKILRKEHYLQSQLRLLTEARDRLLPKLMSGEIEV